MKTRLAAACVAAGIAAGAFPGAVAGADDFIGHFTNLPDIAEAGYDIDVTGTCSDPKFTSAPLTSPVLEPTAIFAHESGPDGAQLTAHTKVKADAKPGEWPVTFTCGTQLVQAYFRVVADDGELAHPAISVDPAKGVAGTKVTVNVICLESAAITSAALSLDPAVPVAGGGESRPYFAAQGKVKNVKPGAYRVATRCDGKLISTTFTVLGKASAPAAAQVPAKPKRAPETGGGDA